MGLSTNNIGLIILGIIAAVIYWSRGGADSMSAALEEPDALEIQNFTPQMLKRFNGVDDDRVLMAISGKVYDVTPGKAHYGPGGPYAAFAGRDASRGLAKHSFDEETLNPVDAPIDDLSDLTQAERDSLEQWAQFFEGKYSYCGKLVNP